MALTGQDRNLLRQCLGHEPGAWNDFIDRYLGLIYHVIQHTAHSAVSFCSRKKPRILPRDRECDCRVRLRLAAAISRQQQPGHVSDGDRSAYLRQRIGQARHRAKPAGDRQRKSRKEWLAQGRALDGLEALEEVGKLLKKLPARERKVVQLHFIEGRSYEEISTELNIPINPSASS